MTAQEAGRVGVRAVSLSPPIPQVAADVGLPPQGCVNFSGFDAFAART